MKREIEWDRNLLYILYCQQRSAAFRGQVRRAHDLAHRMIESQSRGHLNGAAAGFAADIATGQAVVGQCEQAKQDVQTMLAMNHNTRVLNAAGLASALCGDAVRAESIAAEWALSRPQDRVLHDDYLPCLRALAAGRRSQGTESGNGTSISNGRDWGFAPTYCRGELDLRQRKGAEAAAEFQNILDHRGWDTLSILYPAAYLGLARAAALTGDLAKSRKAYQDLFAAWKDADPDLPALADARREYEKVR